MRSSVAKEKHKDKHTAVVRLKREGLRFELTLHRDAVPTKAQLKDPDFTIDFVQALASDAVFANAAKNEVAKPSDIERAFKEVPGTDGGKDVRAVMRFILAKGELQRTQEDRVEEQEGVQQLMGRIAHRVAETTHALPHDAIKKFVDGGRRNAAALAGLRMQRYAATDIEREMKNIKFRPSGPAASAAALTDVAADAAHALWAAHALPIVRDAHLLTIAPAGATTVKDIAAAVAAWPHGHYLVLPASAGGGSDKSGVVRVLVAADHAARLAKAGIGEAEMALDSELYVPRFLGADELAAVAPGILTARRGSSDEGKPEGKPGAGVAPKGAKSAAKGGRGKGGGAGTAPAAVTPAAALETELARLRAEDSDDDGDGGAAGGRKKKGAAGGKKKKATAKPSPPAAGGGGGGRKHGAPRHDEDEDEDEEDRGSDSSSEEAEPIAAVPNMKPKKRR